MKSLDELDKLRQKLQQDMQVRDNDHEVRVTVSMGTCGIAAGAREIVQAMLEELKEQGLNNVALTQTSCVGLCQHEPLLEVARGGEKTTYINVDREKAREIVRKHLVQGQVIKDWTNPEK
ncbi:(2Fe-2S) ferredoxin domain-containing protein [Desulfallas thermosapovorans]|uniref:NAD(P)-dependent iron-only hydrogenase iron-sulfur protein n=1 Tax=Desulfallas thermosapovorans DSM 6562 TaxID=1121431 RepID=A0A5S4ZVD1_9FIRM|nr:(2Fe-2S) ferredoxin domain-containing protein [Desulfallas thermosapovorans]TYO96913.1 NAD(P)-dependent iron-only hydrogenase iron-sulfur protein [Desulfallas thermosapovorans DSM 6562]